jgi:CHAD domain-containing protein
MHAVELCILLHRALESRVDHLVGLLAIPGWQEDPEQLHQVRIASRRARSALDLVRPDLYPGYKRQARSLRDLTSALGATRELDVHARDLEAFAGKVPGLATGSALEHALEALEVRRAKARKKMARGLAGRPCKRLPDLLKVPSLPDPFLPGDLSSDVWECLEPPFEAALSPLPGLLEREDPEALHCARIRLKRFRYTLEVLGAAFPAPPSDLLQRLRGIQTALGDHHDLALLETLLQDLHEGLHQRGRATLASGMLEVLAYVGEARLGAFERFRRAVLKTPLDGLRTSLRLGLGLPGEGAP